MKRFISFFVLTGIILSNFFAQDACSYSEEFPVTIWENTADNTGLNVHKFLIFSETNIEIEDAKGKSKEFDFTDANLSSPIHYIIKNNLSLVSYYIHITQQEIYHLPLFLVVRSIRI